MELQQQLSPMLKQLRLSGVLASLEARHRQAVDGQWSYIEFLERLLEDDGLPAGWRTRADLLLSLSAMTMPHELARAVLAEQIYRAFAILNGHPYVR